MKINRFYKPYVKHIDIKTQNNREKKVKDMNIKQEKSADVQISKSAKKLMEKINENNNPQFSKRVEEIRQAVIEGKYKVSSEEMGEKILQSIKIQKESEK